jgi:hypothetical protein
MSYDIADARWQDLATKGFLQVRGFLGAGELARLQKDYGFQVAKAIENANYDVPSASPLLTRRFEPQLQAASAAVRAATGIDADMTVCGLYFAIEQGISFPWHQDHESFFLYQQHAHYLNFYVPIVKPDPKHSNLCLVPFDRLSAALAAAEFQRLVGGGATRFFPEGGHTRVCDDERGEEFVLPIDIEGLKVTPELEPGDLLLMRGDMIHRTQDTHCARIAVSFRRTRSTATISRSRLVAGAAVKHEMMSKNAGLYEPLRKCLDSSGREEITAMQLAMYHQTQAAERAKAIR